MPTLEILLWRFSENSLHEQKAFKILLDRAKIQKNGIRGGLDGSDHVKGLFTWRIIRQFASQVGAGLESTTSCSIRSQMQHKVPAN